MVNRIRTIYHHGLNKGFISKFGEGVQYEKPEEGWRMH